MASVTPPTDNDGDVLAPPRTRGAAAARRRA